MAEHRINFVHIIPLIEKRPVLWNNSCETYKLKKPTYDAWEEICSEYNSEYAEMSESQKTTYRTLIIKKWGNIKDAWKKSLLKKMKGDRSHKYVYDKQLEFLKKDEKYKIMKKRKWGAISKSYDESNDNDEMFNNDDTYMPDVNFYGQDNTQSSDDTPLGHMIENKRKINMPDVIPLVEKRPLLWNSGSQYYKHVKHTHNAWEEVCAEHNRYYTEMSESDRKTFRKILIKKWVNVRDTWRKSLIRKLKGDIHHTYMYDEELKFLRNDPRYKHMQRQTKSERNDDDEYLNSNNTYMPDLHANGEEESVYSEENSMGIENESKIEISTFKMPEELEMSNPLEASAMPKLNSPSTSSEPEDRHISFIRGVLPTLQSFTERQVVSFQIGVLKLIESIVNQ